MPHLLLKALANGLCAVIAIPIPACCLVLNPQAFCVVALNGPKHLVTAQHRQRIAALLGANPLQPGVKGPFTEAQHPVQDLISACAHQLFCASIQIRDCEVLGGR
jgi:hypothetical protein